MQRTANTTKIGLGLAGALTASLAFAPAAFANQAPVDEAPVDEVVIEKVAEPAPFLDLLYAAPYQDLHLGDTTTILVGQTLPASYTLSSTMANGNKCFFPVDMPAAETTKTGTDVDADHIKRTIVSSGVDADDNGIDDHYEGAYDENGIAECKIKVVDEFGNFDWKYIYINLGLPKTPAGENFDGNATTTTVVETPATTAAPVEAAPVPTVAAPAHVADVTVAPDNTVAAATLPRTGTSTWVEALIGSTLAAGGAAMVMFSRRRAIAAEVRSNG